ncbi:MAG: hypothetical protein JGK24_19075 [Microcoleus sp. PH2017_29_MFU_D_A]|uniref:hypothetical protein n=1 Tax=unclassified Microcoleus TaxID=2642155 RepID=UPI001E0AA0A6|nr:MULTISPECIES: hypothetical protein [unclassified Microcoleus]MCC3588178.1 hypothetical protein [Microcoleus sp. PH2017_30_WIL_O_A]MCC3593511.1 hypothetical protein [Microcoleus sp. PH2017_28_MFU_U_A]MCC3605271.1 hypothetical protein [Microcoleus sp. PH2017_29_MFU_D_A]MCC3636277.1 hypothetical protein [Microcoleus sp. PH2017_37_MFU_D_B]
MPVIETSIDKAWGFSTYFFHTLIKQHPIPYGIALLHALFPNPSRIRARSPATRSPKTPPIIKTSPKISSIDEPP